MEKVLWCFYLFAWLPAPILIDYTKHHYQNYHSSKIELLYANKLTIGQKKCWNSKNKDVIIMPCYFNLKFRSFPCYVIRYEEAAKVWKTGMFVGAQKLRDGRKRVSHTKKMSNLCYRWQRALEKKNVIPNISIVSKKSVVFPHFRTLLTKKIED